jgi:hypothetical protein
MNEVVYNFLELDVRGIFFSTIYNFYKNYTSDEEKARFKILDNEDYRYWARNIRAYTIKDKNGEDCIRGADPSDYSLIPLKYIYAPTIEQIKSYNLLIEKLKPIQEAISGHEYWRGRAPPELYEQKKEIVTATHAILREVLNLYSVENKELFKPAEDRYNFDDGKGFVPAKRHKNMDGTLGGWVADTAHVDPTCFLGGGALVFGKASVTGNAGVYGKAAIYGNAQVSGNATIQANAKICGNSVISGHASIFGKAFIKDLTIGGYAQIDGTENERQ